MHVHVPVHVYMHVHLPVHVHVHVTVTACLNHAFIQTHTHTSQLVHRNPFQYTSSILSAIQTEIEATAEQNGVWWFHLKFHSQVKKRCSYCTIRTFLSKWWTPQSFEISLFLSARALLMVALEAEISSIWEPRWVMSSSRRWKSSFICKEGSDMMDEII